MMSSDLATHDQRQTRRRAGSALRASSPAADQPQDRMASRHAGIASCSPRLVTGRGFGLGALSHSHRSESSPVRGRMSCARFLPVGQCIRPTHKAERLAAARCVSVSGLDCRPTVHNRLAHHPLITAVAAALIHHRRPLSCSSAASNNASKSGQELGNIIHERGQIVQGQERHD